MVRHYKRKHARNPDRRMVRVVELRAEGLSLRQIGEALACDEKTVRNDLARWEREHSNVTPLLRKNTAENTPRGGEYSAANSAPEQSNVVSLSERKAAR